MMLGQGLTHSVFSKLGVGEEVGVPCGILSMQGLNLLPLEGDVGFLQGNVHTHCLQANSK